MLYEVITHTDAVEDTDGNDGNPLGHTDGGTSDDAGDMRTMTAAIRSIGVVVDEVPTGRNPAGVLLMVQTNSCINHVHRDTGSGIRIVLPSYSIHYPKLYEPKPLRKTSGVLSLPFYCSARGAPVKGGFK